MDYSKIIRFIIQKRVFSNRHSSRFYLGTFFSSDRTTSFFKIYFCFVVHSPHMQYNCVVSTRCHLLNKLYVVYSSVGITHLVYQSYYNIPLPISIYQPYCVGSINGDRIELKKSTSSTYFSRTLY